MLAAQGDSFVIRALLRHAVRADVSRFGRSGLLDALARADFAGEAMEKGEVLAILSS